MAPRIVWISAGILLSVPSVFGVDRVAPAAPAVPSAGPIALNDVITERVADASGGSIPAQSS